MFIKNNDIGKHFGVELIQSSEMDTALTRWDDISSGNPYWLDHEDGIKTINMAKLISDTRAKLITLDIGITVNGSERANYLQEVADKLIAKLPDKLEEAVRMGGMMLKFNGETWDFILPGDFGITKVDGSGRIVGAIFAEHITHGKDHFTRLEYHRFQDKLYIITNKAFMNNYSSKNSSLGAQIPMKAVEEWADMQEETAIANLEQPLFSYFRLPGSNIVDSDSPLGMSCFANAIEELRAIDIAISRKDGEVEDSKHITFVGQAIIQYAQNRGLKLPRFVQGLGMGTDDVNTNAIKEHVPTMLTAQRIQDINFNLSMAGVKCGFSEGVFVLDGQTGMVTATQIESDDRDTIQTIKNDRDALQTAIEAAMYGADALASILGIAPLGEYETEFSFGDITYSYEEDKTAWRSYVAQGWVPAWRYFVKFEKMTEEEAKALPQEVVDAQMAFRQPGLFDGAEGME